MTDIDLAAVRNRSDAYQRLLDGLDARTGTIGELSKTATARALGLAASLVAGDVPDLLAALDAAHAGLAFLRGDRVDPLLLRWCEWPGCWAHFEVVAGPAGQPGWIRASHNALLLCPPHAAAGHIPDWTYDQTLRTVTAECSCGDAADVTPGNQQSVTRWWRDHVTAAAPRPAGAPAAGPVVYALNDAHAAGLRRAYPTANVQVYERPGTG